MKIIIGLVGDMGSGKSTVASYLTKKYNASHYTYSTPLKQILDILCIEPTRVNLIDLFLVLAPRFGEEVLARPMKQAVENDPNEYIVVEGIRRPADISLLKQLPHFHLIGVRSESRTRYDRITKRREKTDDDSKTYEEFLEDHQRKTELLIGDMVESSDVVIDNNGSIDELEQQIETMIGKIRS